MGKIGIFLQGQNGDLMTAMSVLKYRDILWPDKELVWFVNPPNDDLLKFHDIEIRPFLRGWGLPDRCKKEGPGWEDWSVLVTEDNRLNQKLKHQFELTKDLEEGYFPAPHQLSVEARHGLDYPNVSRKVFGVPAEWEWHPVLLFSEEERRMAREFISQLPYEKTVMIETFAGSGQSILTDEMIRNAMQTCREKWGQCNFIFASHKYLNGSEVFPFDLFSDSVVSCAHFTVRQAALLNDYCDLFISVSSGISVATSCWGAKPVTKLQYCGSFICSTVTLANGPIVLVTTDDKPNSKEEFETKLKEILNTL